MIKTLKELISHLVYIGAVVIGTTTCTAKLKGWQPMETVPKDGTLILCYHKLWKTPMTVSWFKQGHQIERNIRAHWMQAGYTHFWPDEAFSHWMPLPKPPIANNSQS
jgi:hypothetical protein